MNRLISAEATRLLSSRLWLGALIGALVCGGVLIGGLTLLGPENFDPPMPGLDTEEGVRGLLGMLSFTVFVPAALGTLAVTSEYRHRTISFTFLFEPRRWRVLVAKLITFAVAGLCYGAIVAGTAGAALYGGAAARDITLGLPGATVAELLVRVALAMAAFMVIGVGFGALIRNQIAALAAVVGYLYLVELVLLAVPGINAVYPYLPGGATASLTGFTYLADAIAEQTSGSSSTLLSAPLGALVLAGYAIVAAALAVAVPLRRDVT
ncbi:ABC transporter permease [Actinoalloteichus caeruleus]|uniref:ABC transporter permease n=1 Tax=Actinoalloteichus cyanogriseus TaxID=2893586 RepID=UPI0004AB80B6|nr:ABC transporter permease [Actinoalloteichus caeruleus]